MPWGQEVALYRSLYAFVPFFMREKSDLWCGILWDNKVPQQYMQVLHSPQCVVQCEAQGSKSLVQCSWVAPGRYLGQSTLRARNSDMRKVSSDRYLFSVQNPWNDRNSTGNVHLVDDSFLIKQHRDSTSSSCDTCEGVWLTVGRWSKGRAKQRNIRSLQGKEGCVQVLGQRREPTRESCYVLTKSQRCKRMAVCYS